jgi:trans-2-enoyl-CoA reductase
MANQNLEDVMKTKQWHQKCITRVHRLSQAQLTHTPVIEADA